jgi:hypothetical protein
MAVVMAALAACGSSDNGPGADPFAVLWVRNQLSAGVGDSIGYKIRIARVNQPGVVDNSGDVNRGEEACRSYAGIPEGTPNPLNDSLAIQVWFVGWDAVPDTVKSVTFMPVTGPDPDNPAKWGITLTDSGVVVQENPDSFPSCTF